MQYFPLLYHGNWSRHMETIIFQIVSNQVETLQPTTVWYKLNDRYVFMLVTTN